MAGKKTGKRLLTWVLVLVMALSLLPLNVLAANRPETDSSSGMNFTKQLVSETPDNAGNYTIQMTAQATGTTTTTTKVEPMDIVLVLDQSGSMGDKFGTGTRQSAMKAAVNSFIGEVADKYSTDADHHMAIVTFSDDAKTLADWTAVDSDGADALTSKIGSLKDNPSGATNVEAGMTETQSLMSNAPTGQNRQKTVIVFTDGVPTTASDFSTTVANAAIDAAKSMKNSGVTIYTVGIFNGAKPEQLHGDKWDYALLYKDVPCNGNPGSYWGGSWAADLFGGNDFASIDVPAGNRFLNYLSSNFKNATAIGVKRGEYNPSGWTDLSSGTGYEITQNFTRDSSDYYLTASDASSLKNIFKVLSNMVPEPVNDKLDKNTVITDTLSDYFKFAGTADDVKVYAEKPDGTPRDIGLPNGPNGINVNNKTVTVTGYDFSAHHTESADPEKLVIEIKVKPSGTGYDSDKIPTNADTAGTHAGTHAARVEVEVKSEDGTGTETKVVTSHETAIVDGYSVTYAIGDNASWPNNGNGPAKLYYPQGADVPVTDSKPTREGYQFIGWTLSTDDTNVTAPTITEGKFTMPAANVILTAQWTVNTDTKYTVNHYQQNLDDNDYKLFETESDKTGTTGEQTTATAKNYEGFTVKSFDQQTIAADGSTVVDIYYDRNTYSVTYTDGVNNETIFEDEVHQSVKYGASVPAYNNGTDPSRENYTFAGWEPSVPATMPANNLMFAAKWEKNPVGDGTFDFNDVISGDGKNTPAITKTVKGNVGRNFKETFEVTVKGTDAKSKDTMSAPDYTGKAEVIASKSLKDVPFLFKPEVVVNASVPYGQLLFKPEVVVNAVVPYGELRFTEAGIYTYTVREQLPDKTSSRMSYDTTEYTLTIEVVLDEDANTYQVESWQFTAGNRKYPANTPLNIVNTYRTYHPSTPSKPTLNTGDHYAYVMGYPDGTVRPNGSITRAEVSAILFRLLSDKTRDEYFTTESSFTDVKAGAWYNNSIATLEKAGVIVDTAKGGAFRPNEAITRAELAAMLAQFSDAKPVKGVKFSDVSAEHWAYEAIAIAAKMGWIEGYPDGTFRPDATITRAEMMTLVNRALERVPSDEDHLLSKRVMLTFPDCKSGDWFYIAVQEATNSHTYERAATEKNGDEQWTALRANRDWTLLEK